MEKDYSFLVKALKWIVIPALLVFAFARVYYALTDDFRLSNITYPLPYDTNWEVPAPTPEGENLLSAILDQPYSYLGKGAQSYVFESQDGKYVLKFFKFKHIRPSIFVEALPPFGFLKQYKDKQTARKQRKLFGVFNSYKLAFDTNKDESGLIFIQLNTEGNPNRAVSITDKIGINRTISLKHYPFVIQNKGVNLRDDLNGLLAKGDVATTKVRLGQIIDLYANEYAKGVYDHDHGIMRNTGFVGDKPIHLDVGKLLRVESMRDKSNARKDIEIVVANINSWVKKQYPQYSKEIGNYLDEKVEMSFRDIREDRESLGYGVIGGQAVSTWFS